MHPRRTVAFGRHVSFFKNVRGGRQRRAGVGPAAVERERRRVVVQKYGAGQTPVRGRVPQGHDEHGPRRAGRGPEARCSRVN
jgi:hypothetical protein